MAPHSKCPRKTPSRFPRVVSLPRVVHEPAVIGPAYKKSHVRRHAEWMRAHPTRAEQRLRAILNSVNYGVLKGRFRTQHMVSGRWIVDFFFPEVRLAIELDGPYHRDKQQQVRDREKEQDCARFDITLLRLTNSEVFGDLEKLTQKLRYGWRMARSRENKLIGKEYRPLTSR